MPDAYSTILPSNANAVKLTWKVENKTFAALSEYNFERIEFDPLKNYQLE